MRGVVRKWERKWANIFAPFWCSPCPHARRADHHGLRIMKAVLATRQVKELTAIFKEATRQTMRLVENQLRSLAGRFLLLC